MLHRSFLCMAGMLFVLASFSMGNVTEEGARAAVKVEGKANPALAGVKQVYVVIDPAGRGSHKDGLEWEVLEAAVRDRLTGAGFTVPGEVRLGKGVMEHDVPELRLYIELLKFADSDVYVYRVQLAFATKVWLKNRHTFYKADAWRAVPVMDGVPTEQMPARVQVAVMDQVEAFIRDVQISTQQMGETAAQSEDGISGSFVASKNSKVYHKADCSFAKKIKPDNAVWYENKEEAEQAGKRPCRSCKP